MTYREYTLPRKSLSCQTQELKDHAEDNTTPMIRLYSVMFPNYFNIQIRTHGPIGYMGRGKDRDMISTATISVKEWTAALDFMLSNAEQQTVTDFLNKLIGQLETGAMDSKEMHAAALLLLNNLTKEN